MHANRWRKKEKASHLACKPQCLIMWNHCSTVLNASKRLKAMIDCSYSNARGAQLLSECILQCFFINLSAANCMRSGPNRNTSKERLNEKRQRGGCITRSIELTNSISAPNRQVNAAMHAG